MYLGNKRILNCYNKVTTKLKDSKIGFSLLKDPKEDFKLPLINENLKGRNNRKFNSNNSKNVWRYSDSYVLDVDKKDIIDFGDKIKILILRSVEIVKNNEKKLILKTKNYSSEEIKKYEEMSSDDYHFKV